MSSLSGHRALRKGRRSLPGQTYLLTTVIAARHPWFGKPELARLACRSMVDPACWGDARLLCWVLMPDHWHGPVELGDHDGLSQVMTRFKSLVSRNIRAATGMRHIWARGFHDRALRHDESVLTAARYIVANPVRAGLASRVGDYPYWNCVWL